MTHTTKLPQPEPDEELVEKIIDTVKTNVWMPQVRKDIRTLLQGNQSRQGGKTEPERPRITREEIDVFFLPKLSTQHLKTYKAKLIISWLKSRCRIKVVDGDEK